MDNEISKNMLKSNTSLVGIVCKDGIVLGADRRSTAGTIVMNKASQKINKINKNIAASYTGGVSDIQLTNKMIAAELRIKELRTKSRATIKEAAHLLAMMIYKNIRNPAMIPSIVGTLIAGVDEDGSTSLYTIEPAGGVVKVDDYDANFSSGMPYILGLLERQWKKDITLKEGVQLASESLKASTQRDVGSGNGIDVFTITKNGIEHVISQGIVAQYK
ncbi:proteasome subunit beta [Candidatus Parvarchaeota archaeon]|jgi:proteasome beta subunit|nr:MAG: proteasome subunit beta [Candidatus Parvarchaeota archaeon]HIG51887.1 proteasome subunit beta [Candidatus Pacearchaeota archaeon]